MVSPKGKMNGRSSTEQYKLKVNEAAEFTLRWKWTSKAVLDALNGSQRRGLATGMVKAGLLRETKTAGAGILPGVPHHILTLTQAGVDIAERYRLSYAELGELPQIKYDIHQYTRSQAHFAHDHCAQLLTVKYMHEGRVSSFTTPVELKIEAASRDSVVDKLFDCHWYVPNVIGNVGVEVELSPKYGQRLDQFVHGCLSELISGRVRGVIIATDMPEIVENYQRAFSPGRKFPIYKRHKISGHWVSMGHGIVPTEAASQVGFILLGKQGEHTFVGAAGSILEKYRN